MLAIDYGLYNGNHGTYFGCPLIQDQITLNREGWEIGTFYFVGSFVVVGPMDNSQKLMILQNKKGAIFVQTAVKHNFFVKL